MDRPVGSVLVAVLVFVRGLFALIVGFLAFAFGSVALLTGAFTASAQGLDAGTTVSIWGIVKLVTGLIFLGLGYGLFKGASWSWMWTVLFLILAIIMDFVPLVTGGAVAWISLAFSLIVLVYMLTNNVRNAYLE